MFFILVPIFLMALWTSYMASVHLTGHLRRLACEMNQLYPVKGETEQAIKKDDIDMLEESFREPQERMNRALEEVKEAEKKRMIAELNRRIREGTTCILIVPGRGFRRS